MKYYETNFEEYVRSSNNENMHPELKSQMDSFPDNIANLPTIILYGPSGVGKYTQALSIIQKYSNSGLRYDRKLIMSNEKNEKKTKRTETVDKKNKQKTVTNTCKNDNMFRMSDIHYEIDMSLLGCNSKTLWHETFFQIVDIVSITPHKSGIILCKNFHSIYNELLDVFNSYIRHPLKHMNIHISFILLTEHLGFIPDNIINASYMLNVKRPSIDNYLSINESNNMREKLKQIGTESIMNAKEIHVFKRVDVNDLPVDVFNIITDNIIRKMLYPKHLVISEFRNDLYDLLIYNVDVADVICHIIFYFINNKMIKNTSSLRSVLRESYTFFKYYNNNYRPIYHLENIMFFIIKQIHYSTDLNA